ncbi:MAG: glutathione S-transferase family protein [Sneathiella sp.]|nr:glutathione S-transferase family protein [Sneathiella sp.]
MPSAITVCQFPPVLDMQPSSFGLKLETWLRMAGLDYDVEFTVRKMGPKGKIPYIRLEAVEIGDTELIIEALSKKYQVNMDQGLSDEQKAHSTLLRRLTEEHLYFAVVYSRWADPKGWQTFKGRMFGSVPLLLRKIISNKLRKQVIGTLHAQGIGRHSGTEIYGKARADLQALSKMLGDKPYFLGAKATSADASLYGLLANIHFQKDANGLKEILRNFPNLTRYCERLKAEYWPDAELGGGEEGRFRANAPADISQLKSA